MRIAILQHTSETPASSVATWLEQNNLPYKTIKAYEGERIPKVDEIDWLIALGGGMNIDDEKTYPFLRDEKKIS